MNQRLIALAIVLLCFAPLARAAAQVREPPPAVRTVNLKSADGTPLKGDYFSAHNSGPGVLLLHQVNRDRRSWDGVARQMAAAGINVLTLDTRGHGESGGTPFNSLTSQEQHKHWREWPDDADAGFQFLVSQPGVDGNAMGIGGAGLLGVDNGVEVARRHPAQVKSLVLISGETFRDGLQFLHQASHLPGLYVVSDLDEYPPTVEAVDLLYATATNPGRKLIRYPAPQEAPWLWYEPFDLDKVASTGNHGTDLFRTHPELTTAIVDWFVSTLIKTPGQAPADPVAAAPILADLETPGGAARVTQQLLDARNTDPGVQIFPEISASIIGFDYQRAGDEKSAQEVLKLVALAYPDSADALSNLADCYLKAGQKGLARRYAERALVILDAHMLPASSWSDTDQQRGQIRKGIEQTLAHLGDKHD